MVGRIAVLGTAVASLFASVAPVAQADSVAAPQVYMRLVVPGDEAVALTPWMPLTPSLTVSGLGPYEIGVIVQAESGTEGNRQAIETDLVSEPGGPAPTAWAQLSPYAPYCGNVVGTPGAVSSTGTFLYFHGDGAYRLNVSAYTDAQHNTFPGNSCSGGPTTSVTLNVAATTPVSIVGTPLVPRGSVPARGFNGIQAIAPDGTTQYEYRCARDPSPAADGSVTGTKVVSGTVTGFMPAGPIQISETNAFSGPGRWACAVRLDGGDGQLQVPTPWVTSAAAIVRGQYGRDPTRTFIRRLPRHREQMFVNTIRSLSSLAAGGQLTLKLFRGGCRGRRKLTLSKVQTLRARIDGHGRAVFTIRPPARQALYRGQLYFGGTPFVLPTRDADMLLQVGITSQSPLLGFIDPTLWNPCEISA